MADLIITESGAVHRPRNVDWKRAAALLYGDWGTSKAYVIGLAFLAAGFSSLPIILAVCALTGLVGINYMVICRYFPDGGGVYSAARSQGRLLAVVGALLLLADLTVTAALSGWSALSYITSGGEHILWIKFVRDHISITTIGILLVMAGINYFGPKHSGSLAVALALPTLIVVVLLIAVSAPHLTTHFLQPRHESLSMLWVQFVGVILALSGAESIKRHRRDEARSGLDHGPPERGSRIAKGHHPGCNRGCLRHGPARLGDAFSAGRYQIILAHLRPVDG